nr:glycosyltransferase family 4 protein [Deinococcus sp. 6GRE01]
MVAARLQGSPVVVEFHGGLPGDVRGPLGRLAIRCLCRADAVVVINRLQERALLGRFPWVRDRLHRVPNGVQLPPLDLDSLIPRRLAGRELLFMSRLLESKGLLDTVRALPSLPGVTLNVAGTGPAAEPARALAAELGVASRVVFHGHVSGDAKSELLRRCALMVFPSYYPEGQPIVLLEALAWGLPVVTCAVEPITDLITTECGRLIPPRSPGALALATQELLASPARYGVVSRHNRTLAAFEYDLNLVARRFVQLYRQVQWSRP